MIFLEQTPIYHFNKPARSEKVNVDLLNQNMDIVENNLKNISDNLEKAIDETTEAGTDLDNKLSDEIARAINSEAELDDKIAEETNRAKTAESSLKSTIDTNKPNWDDKYTKNEIDNKFSTLETNIDWKEAVDTYTDITVKYPNPQDGWTVNVKDTDYTYRFSGTSWVPISANSIPKATNDVDGLLSKEGYAKYEDANNKKHTHSNKSVLDGITSALVEAWNNAVTALKTVVTGIKGDSETAYRHGDVNITKANIGLGNVPNVTTNNQTPTFTQASARENIVSGNTLSVIMGKIMKYFADLKTVAFTGSYNDLSGKPTIPTALPANGGNADTVDSKHASDLVLKAGDTMTGALSVPNLTDTGLTASRAVTSDANKKLVSSAVTATELGYLSGVTSAIQTQLNNKANSTGNVTSATKLQNARKLKVNLASTADTTFDGSADVTNIGVAGVLPVANGGTGNTAGKAAMVAGTYSGSGGKQPPTFVGKGNVKFIMTNGFNGTTGLGNWADCLLMDTYTGTDVNGATALAITKTSNPIRAYIVYGSDTSGTTNWTQQAELLTTLNYKSTVTPANIGAATATKVTEIEKSLKTVVYQSAEPTSGLVDNLVWIG